VHAFILVCIMHLAQWQNAELCRTCRDSFLEVRPLYHPCITQTLSCVLSCRSSAGSGTLAAQNQNPYSTPNAVYVPGTGSRSAPAGSFPPAPAPGPVVALGPLGAQAQQAAQNTSFGETQLSGVGPIYKKQDSLEPVCSTFYFQSSVLSSYWAKKQKLNAIAFKAGAVGSGTSVLGVCVNSIHMYEKVVSELAGAISKPMRAVHLDEILQVLWAMRLPGADSLAVVCAVLCQPVWHPSASWQL